MIPPSSTAAAAAADDDPESKRRRLAHLFEEEQRIKRERKALGIMNVDNPENNEITKLLEVQSKIMQEMQKEAQRKTAESSRKETFMREYQNEMVNRLEEMAKHQKDMLESYGKVTDTLRSVQEHQEAQPRQAARSDVVMQVGNMSHDEIVEHLNDRALNYDVKLILKNLLKEVEKEMLGCEKTRMLKKKDGRRESRMGQKQSTEQSEAVQSCI